MALSLSLTIKEFEDVLNLAKKFNLSRVKFGDCEFDMLPPPPYIPENLTEAMKPLTDDQLLDDPYQGLP